ncbi:MAG: type II toxin-antitoxin system HicB family antitoxin [Chloroflexi bacterium]|nr:type II toxin-antitoxin system HicB family antitoxin [Chloroflexota bacterium]
MPRERKRKVTYEIVLEPSEEGGFTAYAPSLKGCVSEGETEEEALENIKDAISLWLKTWEDIAAEKKGMLRRVEVSV